jgi:putative oxidoreductase
MKNLLSHLFQRGQCAAMLIERWVAPLVDLAARLYIARVFFLSGLTKIADWDTTLALFTDEYHVPVLPPAIAAFMGAAGELAFPVLLVLGLGGRLGALGLTFVNIMAVVSYYHVLSQNDALLTHHLVWGMVLALLFAHGPGRLSLDAWLKHRFGTARR